MAFVLWCNWELVSPYVAEGVPNPFRPLLFISHRVPGSSDSDPRYQKGWLDLVFIAYYFVFWSFIRQSLAIYVCKPIARHFGLKKEAKLDRFGEQGYAFVYFAVMAAWGVVGLPRGLIAYSFSCYSSIARHGSTSYLVVPYRVLLDRCVP